MNYTDVAPASKRGKKSKKNKLKSVGHCLAVNPTRSEKKKTKK